MMCPSPCYDCLIVHVPALHPKHQQSGVPESNFANKSRNACAGARNYLKHHDMGLKSAAVMRDVACCVCSTFGERLVPTLHMMGTMPCACLTISSSPHCRNFLGQFPEEFNVEGGKGCEFVTYTPQTFNLEQARTCAAAQRSARAHPKYLRRIVIL
eukprot:2881371-Amphidinium_carterae.1